MNRLIAIASGKGGVGKTCVSIGLAQALAQRGRRVTLVDADLGLANVDVQLGLNPLHDIGAVLAGRITAPTALMAHPAGFAVLAGRTGDAALASLGPGGLPALLRTLPGEDVLLDLGAGLGPVQRGLAAAADLLLVLTTDEPTAITDAYAVLKLHRRDAAAGAAGLVVNMVANAAQAQRVHATLDAACRNFLGEGVALWGHIRRDPRVPAAIRAQQPLLTRFPDTAAAQDIHALAAGLPNGIAFPGTKEPTPAWASPPPRT